MKSFSPGQTVNYVAAPETEGGKISVRKAKITEVFAQPSGNNPGSALVDISTGAKDKDGNILHATALAAFSEDHTKENTFDAIEETIVTPAGVNGAAKINSPVAP
jgi:hypothetical protein